jgi:hypothetical protein
MHRNTHTQIVEMDDGKLLSYDPADKQFYLNDDKITEETAFRHWVDQGISEPFKSLLTENIDVVTQALNMTQYFHF